MKIIGVTSRYNSGNYGYVVELSTFEIELITQVPHDKAERLLRGDGLDISKAWSDAMECRSACARASKLPATLRATADCMEAVSERARAIAEAVRDEPATEPAT